MAKYNILFITVDSWNRSFVGCYSDSAKKENLTPHLDSFSNESIKFALSISPSVKTSASFLSILSGCYPCKYGDWFASVSDKRMLISEILQKNGYRTMGFTSNPCTSSLRNYHKGFDIFEDGRVIKKLNGQMLNFFLAVSLFLKNPYSSAKEVNAKLLSHVRDKKTPYFAWIHYMDVHGPYISQKGLQIAERISSSKLWNKAIETPGKVTSDEKARLTDRYKEKMRYLDACIGELLNEIDLENTVVIITADHGDVFGERGYYAHPFLFYNDMTNVPLFVKLPPEIKTRKRVVSEPVSLMDIVPTLIDLVGIDHSGEFDGNSLMPLIEGRDEAHKTEYVISEISRNYACVLKSEWKLIANHETDTFELYNLARDYSEQHNIIDQEPAIANELKEVINAHFEVNKPGDHNPYYNP